MPSKDDKNLTCLLSILGTEDSWSGSAMGHESGNDAASNAKEGCFTGK